MQAIILAAGMGKRLGEFTESNTKCMVEVNGVTLIERTLRQLDRNQLERIVIVTGFESEKLTKFVKTIDIQTPLVFVHNPVYDKTNNIYSLFLAKDYLLSTDTILVESDVIIDDKAIELLISSEFKNAALVAKYESWMDGTLVEIDEKLQISNFFSTKSFSYANSHKYYKTINIYKFGKEFSKSTYVPFLEAYCKAFGHNEYYEQVLSIIATISKTDFRALPIEGIKWYEIDDAQDLEIAEALFSTGKNQLNQFQQRYGGYWRFPGMLDYCYLVNPFFPPVRMKEEIKSNFDVLLTEYPSGLGVNSRLMAKNYFLKHKYVCVGNGAAELIKSIMEQVKGRVGMVIPTFDEYRNRVDKDSLVFFEPQNSNFAYSAKDLMDFFENKEIEMLVLINPDNPSGNLIGKEDVIRLCQWTNKKNITLIVDESFIDFSVGSFGNSILSNEVLESFPNLIIIKSISKSFGVPGLRLGFMASANTDLINKTRKDVSIWNINSFAEFYLQIYSKYHNDYVEACDAFVKEREEFFSQLKVLKWIRVIPSQANYFLCKVDKRYPTEELTNELLEKYNILIKDCSTKLGFEGKNYIRIAIRNRTDNKYLTKALQKLGVSRKL
jgi:histidinol-phosphate/aromatic aminotransferase/cobyric acid decarboxylase-like protein/choline kinase